MSDQHVKQWQQLYAADKKGRLGHAYLLAGEKGIGKLAFAKAFIQSKICEAPKLDKACGECAYCHQFLQSVHPDVLEITAEGSSITIDQVREIEGFLVQKAAHAHKWVLIEEAHHLNLAASQALLKTLEEPFNATFFLTTPQALTLLPTIRSRCQILSFTAPTVSIDLADYLPFIKMGTQEETPEALAQAWQKDDLEMHFIKMHQLMRYLLKARFASGTMAALGSDSLYATLQDLANTMNITQFWSCYKTWRLIQAEMRRGVNFNSHLMLLNLFMEWQRIWEISETSCA